MVSSVLKSRRAIRVNIEIMRAFVKLRLLLRTNANLARRLNELEKNYDGQFQIIFKALRALMRPEEKTNKGPIGFRH